MRSGNLVDKVPCGYRDCDYGKYLISDDATSRQWAVTEVLKHRERSHGLRNGVLPQEDQARQRMYRMFGPFN